MNWQLILSPRTSTAFKEPPDQKLWQYQSARLEIKYVRSPMSLCQGPLIFSAPLLLMIYPTCDAGARAQITADDRLDSSTEQFRTVPVKLRRLEEIFLTG
jgi:hypothetical protein